MVESVNTIIEAISRGISFYETFSRGTLGMNMLELKDPEGNVILSVGPTEIMKFKFLEGGDMESGTVSQSKRMGLRQYSKRTTVLHQTSRDLFLFKPRDKKPDWSKLPSFNFLTVTISIPLTGENRRNVTSARFDDAAFEIFSKAHLFARPGVDAPEGYERVNWTILGYDLVAKDETEEWTLRCVQEIYQK